MAHGRRWLAIAGFSLALCFSMAPAFFQGAGKLVRHDSAPEPKLMGSAAANPFGAGAALPEGVHASKERSGPAATRILKEELDEALSEYQATGSPAAAMRIYQIIDHCRIAEALKRTSMEVPPGEEGSSELRESLTAARASIEMECNGISERAFQDRLRYLASAAQGGAKGASAAFAGEGPDGDPSLLSAQGLPIEGSADRRAVEEWKATATQYLLRDAASCDASAMNKLGEELRMGTIVPRDQVLAVAHEAAYLKLSNGAPSNGRELSGIAQRFFESEMNRLGPLDAQRARQKVESIIDACDAHAPSSSGQ